MGTWGSWGAPEQSQVGTIHIFVGLGPQFGYLGVWGCPRTVASRENSSFCGIEGPIWVLRGMGGGPEQSQVGAIHISVGSRAQFGYLGVWGDPEQSQVRRIHISVGLRAQFGYLGVWGGPPNSRKSGEFIFLWDRGLNLGIWGSGGAPEQSQVRRIHISVGSRAQFGYLGVWGGPRTVAS